MDGIAVHDRRFAHDSLGNAPLEELATSFRWLDGLVWMADAGCLLFQDLPRDRTMRWIEGAGVSVHRSPSGSANGQARDRERRLSSCSQDRFGRDNGRLEVARSVFAGPDGLTVDERRLCVAETGDQTANERGQLSS